MSFKEKIKQARLKVGLSQAKAGNAINRTRSAIEGYEKGISSPNPDQLVALCKLYKTTPNDLLEFQCQQQNEEAKVNQAEIKHTELPWKAFKDGQIQDENQRVIIWATGFSTKNGSARKNAAFIVKACNNHYRIKDSLWLAHEHMKLYLPHYKEGFSVHDNLEEAIKQSETEK